MPLRVAKDDDSETVTFVDCFCTHLFVVVRVAFGDDRKSVAIDCSFRICL